RSARVPRSVRFACRAPSASRAALRPLRVPLGPLLTRAQGRERRAGPAPERVRRPDRIAGNLFRKEADGYAVARSAQGAGGPPQGRSMICSKPSRLLRFLSPLLVGACLLGTQPALAQGTAAV